MCFFGRSLICRPSFTLVGRFSVLHGLYTANMLLVHPQGNLYVTSSRMEQPVCCHLEHTSSVESWQTSPLACFYDLV